MFRLLFILLAIWAAFVIARMLLRDRRPTGPRTLSEPKQMVQCAHCGVYLPKAESIADRNRHYCCDRHRAQGPAQPNV